MEMKTEREYLVGLGLAKPSRGRFSGEAKAALAKARAQGMEFKSTAPVPSKPRSVAVKAPKAKASEAVNPGDVRKWAKDNGIAVSDRGRVSEEIKIKYLESTTADERKAAAAPEANSYGDPRIRYSEDIQWEGVDSNGKKHTVNGRQACTCGYSLMGHVCNNPTALVAGGERITVKPIGVKE